MKTRQRMHQHLREQKEQENAAEEALGRRLMQTAGQRERHALQWCRRLVNDALKTRLGLPTQFEV